MQFTRSHTLVEAMRFDGSRESARALSALFPLKICRHIEHDDVLMLLTSVGLTLVSAGEWIVEDVATGAMRTFGDADFRSRHEALAAPKPSSR